MCILLIELKNERKNLSSSVLNILRDENASAAKKKKKEYIYTHIDYCLCLSKWYASISTDVFVIFYIYFCLQIIYIFIYTHAFHTLLPGQFEIAF